jgi:WD40 repeat protein
MEIIYAPDPNRNGWLRSLGWLSAWVALFIVAHALAGALTLGFAFLLLAWIFTGTWDWGLWVALSLFIPLNSLGGWIVGRLQWLALRRKLGGARPRVRRFLVGWNLVALLIIVLDEDSILIQGLAFAAAGAVLGLCQLGALHKAVKGAAWLIPASAAAWALAFLTYNFFIGLPLQDAAPVIGVAAGLVVAGLVTGLAHLALLESTPQARHSQAILAGSFIALAMLIGFAGTAILTGQAKTFRTGITIQDVAFSADGRRLAAVGYSQSAGDFLIIWDTAGWKRLDRLPLKDAYRPSLALSPDGRLAVVANGLDDATGLWDLSARRLLWEGEAAADVAFSPDGSQFVLGYGNLQRARLEVRDSADGTLLRELPADGQVAISSVAYSPDGRSIATAGRGFAPVKLWDARAGWALRSFHTSQAAQLVHFSPDGRLLIAASGRGAGQALWIWDLDTGSEVTTLKIMNKAVSALAISPGGGLLALTHLYRAGGQIDIYDLSTGQLLKVLRGHTETVTSLAFSPDGLYLASGSQDKTVRLWELSEVQP